MKTAHARVFSRAAIVVAATLGGVSPVTSCDLNGKSFTYRFIWGCIESRCNRSFERMSVVGDKVIVYDEVYDAEHYNPAGQLYYIDKKVEVTGDELQERDEVASIRPELKASVFVSAAIADRTIRTVWEQLYTMKSGGAVRLRIIHVRTLRVSSDCRSCQLLEHSMVAGGVGTYGKQELASVLFCSVSGVTE